MAVKVRVVDVRRLSCTRGKVVKGGTRCEYVGSVSCYVERAAVTAGHCSGNVAGYAVNCAYHVRVTRVSVRVVRQQTGGSGHRQCGVFSSCAEVRNYYRSIVCAGYGNNKSSK